MPEVATPRMVAAVLGVCFALGAVAALTVAAGLEASPARARVMVLAALALVVGTGCAVFRDRLGGATVHAVVTTGTVLVAVGVALPPEAPAALVLGFLLVLVAVHAALFFAVRAGLVHLTACVTAGTTGLVLRGDVAPTLVVALDVVLVAVAAVVRVLAVRASSASVDPLTGLPNRRGLDEALAVAAVHATREGDPLAVALLDLDGFGAVNDALGHEAGDDLLRRTARAWRAALPRDVVLARLGGDEFAVVVPAREARAAAWLLRPLCQDGETPASAGVAVLRPGESSADVLRRADVAMYRAKNAGRGRCELADEGQLGDEPTLVADLRAALQEDRLDVHYQVLRDVQVPGEEGLGEVVGVEALARWQHPVHGPVPPDVFIGLAERSGLVRDLGAAVLARACRDLRDVKAAGLLPVRAKLGVNVSGLELVGPGYAAHLAQLLATTGWPAGDLVLEVTESVVEADSRAALATLRDVAALGVLLAVDDFGTGYSALSRLDEIGAEYLKLDSSFTATVATSPQRRRLVRAVTTLGGSLDLWVVAEGVESAAQSALLLELGCWLQQGFHLGRPVPVEGLRALLTAERPRPVPAAPPGTAGAGVPAQGGRARASATTAREDLRPEDP